MLDVFHQMEVLVNDLKALGEKVEDKDFSHKFLKFLSARFGMFFHIASEDRFGHNDTKPYLGTYHDQ